MRSPAVAFALFASAAPVVAGPLDSVQYRVTVGVSGVSGTGPSVGYGGAAYPLGQAPLFGVVTGGTPEWRDSYAAYPSADFAYLQIGQLSPYIAGGLPSASLYAGADYFVDFELRAADGRTAGTTLYGYLESGWSPGGGSVFPYGDLRGSVLLGDTRYDVRVGYENSPVYYANPFGTGYYPVRLPYGVPPPYQDGDYTSQSGLLLYATVTATPEPPAATPEPGTLALVVSGFAGMLAVRRLRRAAV